MPKRNPKHVVHYGATSTTYNYYNAIRPFTWFLFCYIFLNIWLIIILNFYNAAKNCYCIIIIYTFLYKFVLQSHGFTNNLDWYARSITSEFWFNALHYFWTSFWYLPTNILIMSSIVLLRNQKNLNLFQFFTLTFLILTWWTLIDYYSFNSCGLLNYVREEHVNTLLTNSVNKYHPFIFYFTVTVITLTLLKTKVLGHIYLFGSRKYVLYTQLYLSTGLVLIIFTLFLGSWWAAQEGSWGGWWNWDPSEVFGLVVMLFFVQSFHKMWRSHGLVVSKSYTWIYWLLLLFLYIFIQLNFDLVSHNFGTKINQFVDTYQFFIISILFVVMISLIKSYYLCINYKHLNMLQPHEISSPKIQFFTMTTCLVAGLSFVDLFNNFVWSLIQTNLLNSVNFTFYYATVTIALILPIFFRLPIFTLPLIITLSLNDFTLPIVMISVVTLSIIGLNHSLLYLFILVTYFGISQVITLWEFISLGNSSFIYQHLKDWSPVSLSLDHLTLEFNSHIILNNQVVGSGWSIFTTSTTPIIQNFTYSASVNSFTQALMPSILDFYHNIVVLDSTLCLLVTTLICFLVSTQYLFLKPRIIIF